MKTASTKNELSEEQREKLLATLKARFDKHPRRHVGVDWAKVRAKLEANPAKLWSLSEMEITGGEPDVVSSGKTSRDITFIDCSPESPKRRTGYCYDREALEERKRNRPKNNIVDVAAEMGVEILTEDEYRALQNVGEFDTKSSSWVKTPDDVRKLGGALFCDRRFGRVFVYHNGAQSYYSGRGFRAALTV